MLTADTLTNEQILDLRESCFEVRDDGQTYFRRGAEPHRISQLCNIATNGLFPPYEARRAREEIADLLNARQASKAKPVITYLCHTVYVVTVDYPTNGKPTSIEHDIVRAAERRDLATEKLGVISDGRLIPLSPYETADVRARYS